MILPSGCGGGRTAQRSALRERPPLTQVLDALRPGSGVCAHKVGQELLDQAKERGCAWWTTLPEKSWRSPTRCLLRRERFKSPWKSCPSPSTAPGSWSLGFGRLGKLLAHRLNALGARVSVAARKWADLAWAEAYRLGPSRSNAWTAICAAMIWW